MTQDEKGKTQATRGNQENSGISYDTHSTGGFQKTRKTDGNINVGTRRTNRPWQNSPLSILLGGIVERLLENQKQKLKETRECIERYEREEKNILTEIKKLEQLQALALSSNLAESLTNQPEPNEEE